MYVKTELADITGARRLPVASIAWHRNKQNSTMAMLRVDLSRFHPLAQQVSVTDCSRLFQWLDSWKECRKRPPHEQLYARQTATPERGALKARDSKANPIIRGLKLLLLTGVF